MTKQGRKNGMGGLHPTINSDFLRALAWLVLVPHNRSSKIIYGGHLLPITHMTPPE